MPRTLDIKKPKTFPRIKVGARVFIKGQPSRAVVADRIDDVCLVYRDDVEWAQIVKARDLELIWPWIYP